MCMRAALVRKAEGGGTGARLPICAPPGHAPPGPRAPRALTREGLPRGVSPWRTNPGDGGASAWLPVRVHPCARTRGRGGVSAPPPVRVCPSARIGEGGRRSGTEHAPGSLALVSDAQGRGHRFCALPPRANPGRGGRCSRLERAPLCVSPLRANQGRGAAAPPLALRARVPGKRGEGAMRACSPTPSRVACPVQTRDVPVPCRTSLLRLPSLARKRERRGQGLVPRRQGGGGGPLLPARPCSQVNRGGGGGGVLFDVKGRGRKRGRTCPPPLRANRGRGGRGARATCVAPFRSGKGGQGGAARGWGLVERCIRYDALAIAYLICLCLY
ncbi:hypothetical protein EDB84DRAFT_1676106 [Lactarius hengduanensis]|nr:hypothetical protein EDB84DRAFT_1676106 [Lactarius hengduanensis]